ncbi:DUF4270 domain-containing protein [Flavobacterium sp.]|uniref:DUF4270 domain-containing protein n=1 Tax=Flavobacterium sp. TaxID=239 RepID=UPI002637DB59|nr:DUF4270 domain-containing protein [Flavobacterium sp.]
MNLRKLVYSLFVVFAMALVSCDKDFSNVGGEIVGDEHFGLNKTTFDVVAFNKSTGDVQTNDLPINSLGYYNSPVFGKTKASLVTQLQLENNNPKFFAPDLIDSVYLHIPYFAPVTDVEAGTGEPIYRIDSLLPQYKKDVVSPKIKLGVYESGYFIQDFDPATNLQQAQRYYSSQQAQFEGALVNSSLRLNDDNTNVNTPTTTDYSQNDQFVFSAQPIKIKKPSGTVKETIAPGIFLNLNKSFFQNKIFNAPAGVFLNNNTFKNYFRGLYFKAEAAVGAENQGVLARLNTARGKITIIYKDYTNQTAYDNSVNDPSIKKVSKKIVLNLTGRTVNFFDTDYINPVTTPNMVVGDERIQLKGGKGSMGVIDLFNPTDNIQYNSSGALVNTPNGIPDELDQLRNPSDGKKWLINEANLVFYIDKTAMATAVEPNRILLYDLDNNRPVIDYYNDLSTAVETKYNKFIHGGILVKGSDSRGDYYKVRITNHFRNLITKDSTNVRLGLVVTENINSVNRGYLQTPFTIGTKQYKFSPAMAIVNPLGTILFGSNPNVPDSKRMKLQVYYTKPD